MDNALQRLNMIMEQSSIKRINILERALLLNEISNEFLEYNELCEDGRLNSLNDELKMFHKNYKHKSLSECVKTLQNISPLCRNLSPHVLSLTKLLLVVPVSSCTSERTFSLLRRLKTWLRNTMSHLSILAIHKEAANQMDKRMILEEFINNSEIRKKMFGKF